MQAAFENNATLWKLASSGFAAIAAADPLNSSTFSSEFELQFGLEQQLLPIPEADQGVQLVVNNQDGIAHPWHLHGHSFQIRQSSDKRAIDNFLGMDSFRPL